MAEQKATNVTWQDGEVSREDRFGILRQRGATVWFTGLSGSGKSTIAVVSVSNMISRMVLGSVFPACFDLPNNFFYTSAS